MRASALLPYLFLSLAIMAPKGFANDKCAADVKKHCPEVAKADAKSKDQKTKECLENKKAKLSADCKTQVAAAQAPNKTSTGTAAPLSTKDKIMNGLSACKDDIQKFCEKATDIKTCLKSHMSELASMCKAQLSASGLF